MANRVLLDGAGRVLAFGPQQLTATAGQTVQDCALALADFATADAAGLASGSPYDVTYDGSKFGFRNRAASSGEQSTTARAQLLAQLQAAVTAWPTATAVQKDAAMFGMLQMVLRVAQGG